MRISRLGVLAATFSLAALAGAGPAPATETPNHERIAPMPERARVRTPDRKKDKPRGRGRRQITPYDEARLQGAEAKRALRAAKFRQIVAAGGMCGA